MKKRATKHFALEDWVDFVMEQTSQARRAEMQSHLDDGCQSCSSVVRLWSRLGEVAKREPSLEPPASAVQHVRQAFSLLAEANRAKGSTLIPRIVFDSLWQPAFVGIRSAAGAPRQVIYKAREITIEMHFEAENKSERVNVTGQLSIASRPGQDLPAVPVVISGNKGKVASTSTNRFGEFQLTFVPEEGLQISFGVFGNEEVSIPLGGSGVRVIYRK